MKKNLFLIRHATAETTTNSTMVRDFDRELISKGIMEAARLGKYVLDYFPSVQVVYSSQATRCLETARLVCEQMRLGQDQVIADESLYSGGAKGYLQLLNSLDSTLNAVAIVGHNPDISYFAEYLAREDVGGVLDKGSMFHLCFDGLDWVEISQKSGSLVHRFDLEKA